MESSSYEHKNNLMMVFTQPYYTLAMEPPSSPTSYFAPSVTVADLTPYASDDARPSRLNPTMYVSSVTYGRMGILILSSDQSYDSLKVSAQASFNAIAYGGSASLNSQQNRLAQQTDIKLLMLGGDANSGTRLVTTPAQALQAMNE